MGQCLDTTPIKVRPVYFEGTYYDPYFRLMEMGVDTGVVTIMGVGSGATMAMQLDVIHSTMFQAVGLIKGGLYASADAGYGTTIGNQDIDESILENSIKAAEEYEKENVIEPLFNLRNKAVFIESGKNDMTIPPKLQQF